MAAVTAAKFRAAALLWLAAAVPHACRPAPPVPAGLRFEVSFPPWLRAAPVDGRLLLILSTEGRQEPRFEVGGNGPGWQVFGVDVESLAPGRSAVIDASAAGFPRESLAVLPAGDYTVEALLDVYDTFRRGDGKVVKLHADHGEGQEWKISPGNLLSLPRRVSLRAGESLVVRVVLSREIPPLDPPADTPFVRHVHLRSELLSRFWGRPVELGAVVLLPEGFDEHSEARYPVVYFHGHYLATLPSFVGFRETPPPFPGGDEESFAAAGAARHRRWVAGRMPRLLVVYPQHPNPYYDDSYAVNSENLGPYGDAIARELVPYVERRFRAIGAPWARALYGSSTGGWAALAQQIFYPDVYNGVWANCPDPVDFRAFQTTDLYHDANAYWTEGPRGPHGPHGPIARPDSRDLEGRVQMTVEELNRLERVLGTHGRSGGQFDAWQAVWSPVGEDGYPQAIYDKRTGVVDHRVAARWRESYDLTYVLARDWPALGPRLQGKIHVKVGDLDTFYLDRAVRLLDRFLAATRRPGHGPWYAGSVEFGAGQPHCWTGDDSGALVSADHLSINQRFLPVIARHLLATAPPGADVTSWRY